MTNENIHNGAVSVLSSGLCDFVIIETDNFDCLWECSSCGIQHKDTKDIYKSTTCPNCSAKISKWIGSDDYNDA